MRFYSLAPLILQKLIWIPTRFCLFAFGSLEVRGLENLEGIKGPVIFAANHSNDIDPFMVPASLPFFSRFSPLFYAVREKEFYTGKGLRKHLFSAWFISLWGGYGAKVGLKDYEKSLERHIPILRDGGSFCLFPEGRITRNGNIQEAKGGISFLAHSSPSTIVPVGISHVFRMSQLDFFLKRRKIVISFGEPIASTVLYAKITQPHEAGKSIWKEEAEFIMQRVEELVESPEKEIYLGYAQLRYPHEAGLWYTLE